MKIVYDIIKNYINCLKLHAVDNNTYKELVTYAVPLMDSEYYNRI